ncbi:putative transcription regulator containing HTH domain [Solimicrobium silvestre]|uniref:Putative transcription regulator containing HTH domain n=2 Tax=Solimicrobium silvestre TaxID=2099400 RepID=A0A2S9H3I0_9BURK|nr:transcriptional regulator [Solimicrobium silvestre]PRC94539.1 putative transcription regulator containing HTH domain [Solimicrobium silvestre]
MDIKPIHTEDQYQSALREASKFFNAQPEPGSVDGDRFELLLMVIESYEAKHYPIAPPDPIDAIEFRIEQAGLTVKDLVPMIGQLNRVYEIMARKRILTLPMIRRLHAGLGIPAESLIAEPHT